jgi:hypothetical protein
MTDKWSRQCDLGARVPLKGLAFSLVAVAFLFALGSAASLSARVSR